MYRGTVGHCVDEFGQGVPLSTSSRGDGTAEFDKIAVMSDELDSEFIETDDEHADRLDPAMEGQPNVRAVFPTADRVLRRQRGFHSSRLLACKNALRLILGSPLDTLRQLGASCIGNAG
ncbi:hypothetical protein SAMN06265360_10568 [Haloechinothrix alba]|uniref:Uncharacterized protein n=1 Tax=Haloechinothrix alba TaxID=664784 RepID=A0A238W350_9PSEU|nr:hypothetical protein SAMN06265360_10568 [Haloechinothrix alba]